MEKEEILGEEIALLNHKFYNTVLNDFGIDDVNVKLPKWWYEYEWKEFKKALITLGVSFELCNETSWEEFFTSQKIKIKAFQKELAMLTKT
jgi:hypothetical protein